VIANRIERAARLSVEAAFGTSAAMDLLSLRLCGDRNRAFGQ